VKFQNENSVGVLKRNRMADVLVAARTSPRLASAFQASRKSANLPVSSEVSGKSRLHCSGRGGTGGLRRVDHRRSHGDIKGERAWLLSPSMERLRT
jgi:hypothetical protein